MLRHTRPEPEHAEDVERRGLLFLVLLQLLQPFPGTMMVATETADPSAGLSSASSSTPSPSPRDLPSTEKKDTSSPTSNSHPTSSLSTSISTSLSSSTHISTTELEKRVTAGLGKGFGINEWKRLTKNITSWPTDEYPDEEDEVELSAEELAKRRRESVARAVAKLEGGEKKMGVLKEEEEVVVEKSGVLVVESALEGQATVGA